MARSLDAILSSIPDANRWKLDREIDFEHRDARGQVIPQHLGRIAEPMVDWEGAIADHLGLSEADRSDIRDKNLREPAQQRREALGVWKSRLGSGATYRALIEVFFKAGRLDYTDAVCGILKDVISVKGTRKYIPEECSRFIASVKGKYRERRINREKQWPPCHSDKLVRLELVERGEGEGYSANTQRGREDKSVKCTPLAYGDLFKVESGKRPVRKVLVEGDAGVGKTTLCISVSEDWANGKLFQQFELVLLLPLRMKAVASAGSLPELLRLLDPCFSQPLCDSVARYFEGIEKKSLLIVADGWDELSESERQEGSFLYQLMLSSTISILVTSRPSASAPLRELPDIDRFVEVRGFEKEHIVDYIKFEFASDQEKAGCLLEQLEYNPLVESVCSVPLNCAIICHLWRSLEEALPTTMTELYTKIILNLVLRNVRKIDTYQSVLSLSNFELLPTDLQQSWWLLCEFAFQALEKDQLVFSQEELQAFFPEGLALDKKILCFGLLQSAESVGVGISFHFLHLTFQEYLAAVHLARQPQEKQLEIFLSHKSEGKYFLNRFRMVWKFFFGINSILEVNRYTNLFIQQTLNCVAGEGYNNLSLCHCVFEAHNDIINQNFTHCLVRHSLLNEFDFGYPCTAHDCSAVLYVIANMQECDTGLQVNFGNASENQIKELVDILASKKGKLWIKYLNLSGSRLTVSGLQALESAVRDGLLSKLKNLFLDGSLTSDAGTYAASFVEACSGHCPGLWHLGLSNNNLGVPGASAISKQLGGDHQYRLASIDLNMTNLGDKGLTILVESLKVISNLYLEDNDIHASGVSCLADAICSGKLKKMEELDLSDNPLGLEGTVAVGRMLSSSHCQLQGVTLRNCGLTTVGFGLPNTGPLNLGTSTISCEALGQQLCQMPQNSTMTSLVFDGNSFTGEGIHILAGFMHLCPCLEWLHTEDCGITSDDLIWLLDKLTQLNSSSPRICSKIRGWHFYSNQIDDHGVSALMDHLPSLFPRLGCREYGNIDLSNNFVSAGLKKRLEEELIRRKVLWSTSESPSRIFESSSDYGELSIDSELSSEEPSDDDQLEEQQLVDAGCQRDDSVIWNQMPHVTSNLQNSRCCSVL